MFPDLPMNEDDALLFRPEMGEMPVTISLIKQYVYCPRIVYYETCTPGIRPTTYKMQAGNEAHDDERRRAARRSMFAYQIPQGERHFDVRLISSTYGLSGLVDEVVLTPDEAIIVDYKLAEWAGDNHLLQVAAYSLLAEETFQLPVRRAFVYLMKVKRFEEVAIEASLRNSVLETLHAIQHIRLSEYMPPPVEARNKCVSCEFRRFCGDI